MDVVRQIVWGLRLTRLCHPHKLSTANSRICVLYVRMKALEIIHHGQLTIRDKNACVSHARRRQPIACYDAQLVCAEFQNVIFH